MSKKVKKRASSTSFRLSRLFDKISTTEPSSFAVSIIVIAYAIFLFGGGIYSITAETLPAYYTGRVFLFLHPELSGQFLSDSIITVILYAWGFGGFYAVYQSTKYAYKPRQAYMTLVAGVASLLLVYIFLELSILQKLGG